MKGSDNPFPSVLLLEETVPATPPAGRYRLFAQGGVIKLVDESGTVHEPGEISEIEMAALQDQINALSVTVDGKAAYSHTQTASTITDLAEAVQDIIGASLVGSGVTVSYNDAAGTVTITGLATTDAEAVRDAIGIAMVGVGSITVTVDDAADTITIASAVPTPAGQPDGKVLQTSGGALVYATPSSGLDLEAMQDAVNAMVVAGTNVTKVYDDTAGTLTLSSSGGSGGSGGTGLWRGPWATMSVVTTYDFSAGVPAAFTNPNGWTTRTVEALTGTPPSGTHILDSTYTQASTWPAGRDLTLTIPAGVTAASFSAAIKNGAPPGFSHLQISKNSTLLFDDLGTSWKPYLFNIAAGDVLHLNAVDVSNFNTEVYIGGFSLLAASAPYMIGHTVTHLGKIWRSIVDNNAGTPGSSANWVEEYTVSVMPYVFSDGRTTLVAGGGTQKVPNSTGRTLTLKPVRLDVATAPTGAALICDVHKNGTTVFTTQANRPQVAAGAATGTSATPDVTSWAPGETLTVDVDQVGSTVAGGVLTVTILAEG